ncbi:SDR family NAD-dependent epimerase/dehydratase [Cellvibrio sp. KB43]|uniref:SDR family NAD-dependent epimerase/dehydratase n=1 Tax=Cellvibrio polysaccharolyticus TaxID=2082724 RepID=A0A928V003_9GAMM|nr:SDR family NAD-dependent epimerase/dehydratase [Cellvibrio polysaccharolyticus]
MLRKRRCLVTGGAGFLGSHVCERLLNNGCAVICVDNLYTGSRLNIQHLFANPFFQFIFHDITQPLFIEVDEIYNLACPASPVQYQKDPVQTTKTCVLGAINMLGLAKRLKVKIFQASTSEVYGDPEVHPQVESYRGSVNPVGIRSCYDEGKRCAETLFFDYHRQHAVDIRVARIFNTYGPRMQSNDGRVISNFIIQALLGQPITIFGSGNQTRSFCYVDDLVDGIIALMGLDTSVNSPVNLGNTIEISMIDLATLIISLSDSSSTLIYKDLPLDDPSRRKPNINFAKALFGWTPAVSLDGGLMQTIDFYRYKVINREVVGESYSLV